MHTIPGKVKFFGPFFLLMAAITEFLYLRYLTKQLNDKNQQKTGITYLITFSEISFPAIVLLIIISMVGNKLIIPVNEILNSPPFILYFILVILSSLHLDKRICMFTGLMAGIQYASVSIYFKYHFNLEMLFIPNIIAKSVLIVVCGMVAGFVSDKIKSALIDALHAQDKLINKLDGLVKEKTKEITSQKIEIEKQHNELQDKNKEIVDSIHYAKRIQQALLPSDKYIEKNLDRYKKP